MTKLYDFNEVEIDSDFEIDDADDTCLICGKVEVNDFCSKECNEALVLGLNKMYENDLKEELANCLNGRPSEHPITSQENLIQELADCESFKKRFQPELITTKED